MLQDVGRSVVSFFIRYRFSFPFLCRSVLIINRGERTRTVLSDLYFPINSRHSSYTRLVFALFCLLRLLLALSVFPVEPDTAH